MAPKKGNQQAAKPAAQSGYAKPAVEVSAQIFRKKAVALTLDIEAEIRLVIKVRAWKKLSIRACPMLIGLQILNWVVLQTHRRLTAGKPRQPPSHLCQPLQPRKPPGRSQPSLMLWSALASAQSGSTRPCNPFLWCVLRDGDEGRAGQAW